MASYITESLGSLNIQSEPSLPNVTADLYDFVNILTNEFRLLKDILPEVDPQRILHNTIDFIYDPRSLAM